MTFRYSFIWAYINLIIAIVMSLYLYIGLQPEWWGWLLFSPLFVFLVFESVRKYKYAFIVESNHLSVGSFKREEFFVSDIAAISEWVAKGGRIAVITFADRKKLSFSSHLSGFNELLGLLITQTGLPLQTSDA